MKRKKEKKKTTMNRLVKNIPNSHLSHINIINEHTGKRTSTMPNSDNVFVCACVCFLRFGCCYCLNLCYTRNLQTGTNHRQDKQRREKQMEEFAVISNIY